MDTYFVTRLSAEATLLFEKVNEIFIWQRSDKTNCAIDNEFPIARHDFSNSEFRKFCRSRHPGGTTFPPPVHYAEQVVTFLYK